MVLDSEGDLGGLLHDLLAHLRLVAEELAGVALVGRVRPAVFDDPQEVRDDRRGDVLASVHRAEEARRVAGVAGRAGGLYTYQQCVAVAVGLDALHLLYVAGLLALLPKLLALAGPEPGVAGIQHPLDGFGVAPGHHQDLVRPVVLNDHRDESLLIVFQLQFAFLHHDSSHLDAPRPQAVVHLTDGALPIMENRRREGRGAVGLCEHLIDVLDASAAAGSDHRDASRLDDCLGERNVVSLLLPVGVDGREQDLAGPAVLGLRRPLQGVDPRRLRAAFCIHLPFPGRSALGVDGDDHALPAEAFGAFGDEVRTADGRRVNRDLVGAREERRVHVVGGADAASDGQRHKDPLCGLPHEVEDRPAGLLRGGDVQERDLVGAFLGVLLGEVGRVTYVLEMDEALSLDDLPVLNVEAGDDALREQVSSHRPDGILGAQQRRPRAGGLTETLAEGLELCLDEVVLVEPPELGDVQGESGGHGEAAEEVVVERVGAVDVRVRAVYQVKRHKHEGVIHRQDAGCSAFHGVSAERLPEGGPQGDGGVLDHVVVVVAVRAERQVEGCVTREGLGHVLQELDIGVDAELPGTVEVQADGDLGLPRAALELRFTVGHNKESLGGWYISNIGGGDRAGHGDGS